MLKVACALLALVLLASGEVFFRDNLNDGEAWEQRWIYSKAKESEGTAGKFVRSTGKYFDSSEKDESYGLQTSEDYRFYQISSSFKEFSNKDRTLVIQYSVKHEQNIDCGGGYLKLMPAGLDQEAFDGESAYNIMFGPDICGSANKKVHVIFNYKGENYLINKVIPCETDELTHVYTLIVEPDQTYKVLIDNEEKLSGSLTEDWSFLPPKEINDPEASKPADWVDDPKMDDPEDSKPSDWDDAPEFIADPDAEKPDDWDDEFDGEWEAPQIPNPDYKGEWKANRIDNPDYKGPWVHPKVPNPDYYTDDEIYAYDSFGVVGIEIWQVKAGSIFSDFLITDDADLAHHEADKVIKRVEKESELLEEAKEEERKLAEEAAAAAAAEAEDEEDDEDFEDDEDKDEL